MEPISTPTPAPHAFSEATAPTGTLESFNPATGESLGSVPTIAPDQVPAVVDEIKKVQPFWAELSFKDRARYIRRAANVLTRRKDEVVALITAEQGKVRTEAYSMDVLASVDGLLWSANNAEKILSDEKIPTVQAFTKTRKMRFHYAPIGVIGVISPWNYPLLLAMDEIAQTLMAGNGVIFKPASITCLTGQMIQEIFDEAGLPEGLLRTVHGGGAVGQAMVDCPDVRKIFFTGSVDVGRKIAQDAARQLKGISLELGGKDPAIVLSDANIPHAIEGVAWAGFANMGQTCAGIERVYVMHDVSERFIAGVVERAKSMKLGDPHEWSTEVTAMTDPNQYALVRELVDDAVANGATLHCGGPVEASDLPAGKGLKPDYFFKPTVLTGVNHGMRIMKEEIFGPVIPIITVDSEDEAVQLANDSAFGLGASIWTSDRAKAVQIAKRLETGNAWVNDHMYSAGMCQCSWGGVKDSGLGRSHSKFGFYESVEIEVIAETPVREASMWLYPYEETVGPAMRTSLDLLYGRGKDRFRSMKDGRAALTKMTMRLGKRYFEK